MDYFESALSLVIHKNGSVTEPDVDDLIDRYRKKGIIVDKETYLQTLSAASEHYNSLRECLFVCTENACLQSSFIDTSSESLQELSQKLNCPVEATGCHWECELAPVWSLKTGSILTNFPKCASATVVADTYRDIQQILQSVVATGKQNEHCG